MDVYATDKIRNVVFLGHGGSGKTSLVEAMAFLAGNTKRLGNVTDGNTISDYDKEEIKRKFSITTSMVPIVHGDIKINVLDAPGYFDFAGEAEEACSAADAAVIVVNAKSGVEVGTQKAWDLCEKYNLPRVIYISNMDYENANFAEVVDALKEQFGNKVAPIQVPIQEGGNFTGYVDIASLKAKKFGDKQSETDCDIPSDVQDLVDSYRENVMETVAEISEEFMDRYFGGEEFTDEEIHDAISANVLDGSIVPVTMGASLDLNGINVFCDDIVNYLPSPAKCSISGVNTKTDEKFEADYDDAKPKSAFVWKTLVDPFIGKYSMIKVASGVLSGEDSLYNEKKNSEDRVGKVYVMEGSKPVEVKELHAGDLGALTKVEAATGDTLSTKAQPISYEWIKMPTPYTFKRYEAKVKGEEDKVAQALQKMAQEDLTLKSENDGANRQMLIYGLGDQHLDIVASKLLTKYKVDMDLEKPKVAYRETIRKNSDVDCKYKKQSGGHGQYGHVKMRFSPLDNLEETYEFSQEVVGGAVPKNYFPAVEKGIAESCQKGPLAGYPVVGVNAVLYDGSYHPVDSSEMAFKTASSMAFKKGFMEASPVLLEPIANVKVTVPDKFTGDVMGDLNKRRGRVLGMNPEHNGNTVVEADVPMSEMYGYSTQLRSMTGGTGDFKYEFARYEQAPNDVQEKEIAARKEEEE